jgi:uncharacterized protein (TIGR02444 family)
VTRADETAFPAHPFWDYSLALYSRPGVAEACLALQDQYGLDVNILLFCTWCGDEGPGRLQPEQISRCLSATREWQQRVIQPLRAVRRFCAQPSAVVDERLDGLVRDHLKQSAQGVELDAEHIEQLILAGLVTESTRSPQPAAQRLADAIANLHLYLGALQVDFSESVTGYLQEILRAAFPGYSTDELMPRLLQP